VASTRGLVCRVAPDEILLVGALDDVDELLRSAGVAMAEIDPDALALDVSDGWDAWELIGRDAGAAFARLSELDLPEEGFVQGEVVRLPVKVLTYGSDRLTLLIPAMWGDYLRERIVTDCGAVGVTEVPT